KIMRIESSSINNEDVNKITIDTIKNCSFPIKTNLKSDYIVDSLNKVVPVNELIKFTTKL
ncbi:MAG: hypothetical protein Q7T41_01705, partial [Candidatus Saccharibacteria bacterium]|nr:hypothetical protein [Candidatus Saccharibacteria bacterium]